MSTGIRVVVKAPYETSWNGLKGDLVTAHSYPTDLVLVTMDAHPNNNNPGRLSPLNTKVTDFGPAWGDPS